MKETGLSLELLYDMRQEILVQCNTQLKLEFNTIIYQISIQKILRRFFSDYVCFCNI